MYIRASFVSDHLFSLLAINQGNVSKPKIRYYTAFHQKEDAATWKCGISLAETNKQQVSCLDVSWKYSGESISFVNEEQPIEHLL